MSELMSALDGLAADDLTSLTDRQKLDRTAFLVAVRNRIDAELARSVRSADVTQSAEEGRHEVHAVLAAWALPVLTG